MAKLLWYLNYLFPSSILLYPISSTVYRRSCWGFLIIFSSLLFKIGMVQPAYDWPRRCHLGTTHIPDFFKNNHSLVVVSLATYLQVYCLDTLL